MVRIYQPDVIEVQYKDTRKSVSLADLQTIFRSVWNDVFAFDFPDNKPAEVEFITAEGGYNQQDTKIVVLREQRSPYWCSLF